jgi:geranylgeranyl pyrophosphate synthase|tara:strand:+ start:259 stop:1083 length:825 start_codon:yes stop_codon:yes gene_type:complete
MEIDKYIKNENISFNNDLDIFLDKNYTNNKLYKVMCYSLKNGGKRLRPIIIKEVAKSLNLSRCDYIKPMIAIELVHSYSLIHDDLPCMDDDDYRRGRLSTHKKYDEAQAILAGNSLLTMAFNLLSQDSNLSLIKLLSELSGHEGLAGGQSLDIDTTKKKLNYKLIDKIHDLKTARLFEFCVAAPFIMGHKSTKEIKMSRHYGKIIGKVFQIIDDIHDYENKNNEFINILNVMTKDEALKKCYEYELEADSIRNKIIPNKTNRLKDILSFIINRK